MEKHSTSYDFYKMMWDNKWTDEATLRLTVVNEGNYSTANGITPSEFKEITGIDFITKPVEQAPVVNSGDEKSEVEPKQV